MVQRIINADVKYFVKADQMTPEAWRAIKRERRKKFNKMKKDIEQYGAERLSFGFAEGFNPVWVQIAF